jgi:hypothetical protein
MVMGVLPGHKGRIGHHDHTHFIGQTHIDDPPDLARGGVDHPGAQKAASLVLHAL